MVIKDYQYVAHLLSWIHILKSMRRLTTLCMHCDTPLAGLNVVRTVSVG